MVTSTAAVAMGHNLFNKAYSQASYQISKHAIKDAAAFAKTMTDAEKQMVFSKYLNHVENLEPKQQQRAMSLVLEQRSKTKIKETLSNLLLSKDSKLRLTDADRAFVQGPGPLMDKTGKFAGFMTEKQYASKVASLTFKRKLYASMATGLNWTAAAALNAVVWLFTNETFMGWFKDLGYMATINQIYFPFISQPVNTAALSKAIKMYSLDDRIKDAKTKLLEAANEVVRIEIPTDGKMLTTREKEAEKIKVLQKLVSYYQDHDELLLQINILNKAVDEKRLEYSAVKDQALYMLNDSSKPLPEALKGVTPDKIQSKYTELVSELNSEVKKIASENQRDYQDSMQELSELRRNALEKLNALGFKLTSEELDVEITKYKANPHIPDETDDYPDKYKDFLKALNEFHEVFRLYREETILREFQTHYMNYQTKLDKLQKDFYKKTRYVKWFLRGERLDDIDFVYNGSTDVRVVEKVIDDIQNNQESPLFGAEIGNKWHFDIYDELASFKEEKEKIRKEIIEEIVKDIKWENSKRAIKHHDLSMQNIWTGQNIYRVLEKEQKKLVDEVSKMQKTLLASLQKNVEKIIPAHQGESQTKLQESYEREFIELKSVAEAISKIAPKAEFTAKLNQALSFANQPCDINRPTEISSAGTRMFCQDFITASAPLTQRLKDFTPRHVKYVMDKENYRGLELRAEAIALQVFNYIVQIKKTRDMLPKQREMIMALDLSSIGELNAENILENKEIPATNKLKELQDKHKPKDLGNEKI
ncbi:MAG: hypothetical protein IPM57_00910 [Oligoflexia bacterium]|nr:hypothetical protein [Oligoflexia bacterium]